MIDRIERVTAEVERLFDANREIAKASRIVHIRLTEVLATLADIGGELKNSKQEMPYWGEKDGTE